MSAQLVDIETGGVLAAVPSVAELVPVDNIAAKSHCVAAAAVEIYNRGRAARSGARLPDWFRENA